MVSGFFLKQLVVDGESVCVLKRKPFSQNRHPCNDWYPSMSHRVCACVSAFCYGFCIWLARSLGSETFDLKLLVKYELLPCGLVDSVICSLAL